MLIKNKKKARELIEPGFHYGINLGWVDLGMQENPFKGRDGNSLPPSPQVVMIVELTEIRMDIDREDGPVNLPKCMTKFYTQSMHEKANLRKDIESWQGCSMTRDQLAKGVDVKDFLGKPVVVQVQHYEKKNGEMGDKISSLGPVSDKHLAKIDYKLDSNGDPIPENPLMYFDFAESTEIPQHIWPWIITKIEDSLTYQDWQYNPNPPLRITEEDVPDDF